MGDPTAKRWTARRLAVAACAAAIGALVLADEVWLGSESYGGDPWVTAKMVLFAVVAGGLVGNLAWLLFAPQQRITRLAAVAAGLSFAVWVGFLVWGEPHVPMPSDIMVHHWPLPVAGRANGQFGSVNEADRVLNLAAGPAIGWVHAVWPPYRGSYDDVGRSYVVAALACLLSTAFWLATGNALAARLARRRAKRMTS